MKSDHLQQINEYYHQNSTEGEQQVYEHFADTANREALEQLSRQHWDEASSEKVDLQHILQRIHQHIQPSIRRYESTASKIVRIYSRIAAVLLVPVLLFGLYFSYSYLRVQASTAEITAPKGSRIQFQLPDGSTGCLNGGSVLSYASNFKNNRKLKLSGEAYFDVVKDTHRPFVVKTPLSEVKVLGTKFDVRAYEADNEIQTTLDEGRVEIFNLINKQTTILKPGQQNRIDVTSGKMENTEVDTRIYSSWKDETLRLDNVSFEELVKQLERWYGIEITADASLYNSYKYTMKIKTESLKEVLQLVDLVTPIRYEINGNQVIIKSTQNNK